MMRRWLVVGVLLGFIAMLVAAAAAISGYRQLMADIDSNKKIIASQEHQIAAKTAQFAVVTDAIVASNDYAVDLSNGAINVCGKLPNNRFNNNICSLVRYTYDPAYLNFIQKYSDAAIARMNADSPEQFLQVERQYRGLMPAVDAMRPSRAKGEWRARLFEGIAYAALRQNKMDDASAAAATANQLDPRSAFVGLVALKVACSTGKPAGEINKQLADLRARLEQRVRAETGERAKRNAMLELRYLSEDRELLLRCAYALDDAPRI